MNAIVSASASTSAPSVALQPHVVKFGGQAAALDTIRRWGIPATIGRQFAWDVLELNGSQLGEKMPFGISLTNVLQEEDDEGMFYIVSFRITCVIHVDTLEEIPFGSVDAAEISKMGDDDATYWWRSLPVRTIIRPEESREASGFSAAAAFYAEAAAEELDFGARQKAWRVWATLVEGGSLRFTLNPQGYVDAVDVSDLRWKGKGFGEAEVLPPSSLKRSKKAKFAFKALPRSASVGALPPASTKKAPKVPSKKRPG